MLQLHFPLKMFASSLPNELLNVLVELTEHLVGRRVHCVL